jgi:hypothetical protein
MKKNITQLLLSLLLILLVLPAEGQTTRNAQCADPVALVLNSLTQTTASIGWTLSETGANPGVYRLKVSTFSITNFNTQQGDIVNNDLVLGASQSLTNLTPSTTYYVYIQTNCDELQQGYSAWFSTSFTTPCVAAALPISVNFDELTALPSCWKTAGSNTQLPSISTTHYGNEGKSIVLRGTEYSDTYFISPAIAAAANNLEISFKVYGNANTEIKVGLLEDLAEISSVIPIYETNIAATNIWESHHAASTSFLVPQTGCYVVFYLPAGATQTIYIDDIDIHLKPACSRPQLLNYLSSSVTTNSVSLDWTETGTATSWYVRYIAGVDTNSVVANSHPFILPGLSANTVYKIEVQAACGSDFSNTVSVRTACNPSAIPYFENFNNYPDAPYGAVGVAPDCWTSTSSGTIAPHVIGDGSYWYSPDVPKTKSPRTQASEMQSPLTIEQ